MTCRHDNSSKSTLSLDFIPQSPDMPYNHERLVFVKYMGGKEADSRVYLPHPGTCEIKTCECWFPAGMYHRCKNCGAFFAVMDASSDIPPCVCPNCGKAVRR